MLREGHRVGHMTEWGGKLVGAKVRVATSLHFAEHEGEQWRSSVTEHDVDGAITIARYLIAHAVAAFTYMRVRDEPAPEAEGADIHKCKQRIEHLVAAAFASGTPITRKEARNGATPRLREFLMRRSPR